MAASRVVPFVILLFLLLACQPAKDSLPFATEPKVSLDLDAIKKRGYLQAIIDNNSVSYFIYKGATMGYEYELLTRLCGYLDVDLRIKVISGIDEAINALNTGEGDVLAFPMTVTTDRAKYFSYTTTHYTTHQVLVQKRPDNWRTLHPQTVENQMIRNPVDLIGKDVYVMKGSAFMTRMKNLSQEIGGDIKIHEDSAGAETESLIRRVANGEIPFTVTDQTIAMVNSLYYPDLDINTTLSLPQQISWSVRSNSPQLLEAVNTWLAQVKKSGVFQVIYNKYFNSPRFSVVNITSDYSSLNGEKISPYDEQIKKGAKTLGWDWRLLASLVYQESHFDPQLKSWVGAIGLMQVMPETGSYFGYSNMWDTGQNLAAGFKFLQFLDNEWIKTVKDEDQRIKFVLASYNVGLSHVLDARNLARKYGKDPTKWEDNVEFMMLQKSNPKYYRDPVVAAGYCRCDGPVLYVKEVLQRYGEYRMHFRK